MTITCNDGPDGIAVITLDDGKVNAMDSAFLTDLTATLDDCAGATAVVIAGRHGMFSAGLDVKLLATLPTDELSALLLAFGTVMHRIWLEPRPVVAAATGHAVAGGTILAMVCDHAVAADGPYRWGLTETTIGLVVPAWIIAIARANLRVDRLDEFVLSGRVVSPAEALEAGYADSLVPPQHTIVRALAQATELIEIPRPVYAATKQRLRGAVSAAAVAGMAHDLTEITRLTATLRSGGAA